MTLIKGISRSYFSGESVSRSDAREVAAAWMPYCSVATWYIWRSLDPLPVTHCRWPVLGQQHAERGAGSLKFS